MIQSHETRILEELFMANYVENEEFHAALTAYKKATIEAEEQGNNPPPVPYYIADCIVKIAQNLTMHPRFRGYSYTEDMAARAIEVCLKKIGNYDVERFIRPFPYFTQICWFEFFGYISDEYDENKVKYAVCEEMSLEEFNLNAEDEDMRNEMLEYLKTQMDEREIAKIHQERQQNNKGKFVHRMITQPVKTEPKKRNSKKQMPKLNFENLED